MHHSGIINHTYRLRFHHDAKQHSEMQSVVKLY